jgi:hypothetical protein
MPEPSAAALEFLKSFSDGTTADVLPVSSRMVAEARQREEEQRNARNEAIRNAKPGDLIEGEGIYLGTRNWSNLSKTFHIFAAPEDLSDAAGPLGLNFNQALEYLFQLRNWHGHDGAGYWNDSAFYAAVHTGSYNGEWVIPPRELLDGKAPNGDEIQSDNIIAHKNKRALGKSLDLESRENFLDLWYMSCTNYFDAKDRRYTINLKSGVSGQATTTTTTRVRPVRLVPVEWGVTG